MKSEILVMKIKIPDLKFNNPISENNLLEIINLLDIQSGDTIVDIGGGNGNVLFQMLQNNKAKGISIDMYTNMPNSFDDDFQALLKEERLTFVNEDAKEYIKKFEPESIDCFVVIGSSHIFDGYLNSISALLPYLKPGGFFLIGDGFWIKQPSKEYLDLIGGEESECGYHYENIEKPEKLGLTYLYSQVASEEDWNRFEGVYFLKEELKAADYPKEKRAETLKGLRTFRNAQFKYGRSTMGFGLYLFAKGLNK